MSCAQWNEKILGRLYDEIAAADDAALEEHLGACPRCRMELDELTRVRTALAEDEPAAPRVPRVVVLRHRSRFRPAAIAASLLGGALLAGAGAGAGYALGTRLSPGAAAADVAAAAPDAKSAALDEAAVAMIRREVDRRWADVEASSKTRGAEPASRAVSPSELRAEFAKFERKLNGTRATDLDYMFELIQASEQRTGERIGKTNQALRYVALASNPNASAQ